MTSINPVPSNTPNYGAGAAGAGPATGAQQTSAATLTQLGRSSSNQPASGDDLFESTDSALDYGQLETAAFKLEGLGRSAADIYTIMALMIDMAKEQREGARAVRDAQRVSQQAELQNAADLMREAADKALTAAIVTGVFKMMSGAVSIGGGAFGMKQIDAKGGSNIAQADLDVIRNQGRLFDGSGQMVSGLGDMIAAGLTRESTLLNADQKEAEAAAQMHETGAQREAEFMSSLQELVSKSTSLLQEIQQSNNESEKRAASV